MGPYDISLTRKQEIALSLIHILKDPGLISYFLRILYSVEFEHSRDFHCSLRNSVKDNWEMVSRQSKDDNLSQTVQGGIPINFDIPLDPEGWRRSKELMIRINYTFHGYIELGRANWDYAIEDNWEELIPEWNCFRQKEDAQSIGDLKDIYLKKKMLFINKMSTMSWQKNSYELFREYVDDFNNYDEVLENLPEVVDDIPIVLCNLNDERHLLINYVGYD